MKKLDLNSIKISLIIPTLNAAEYMPGLIDILGRQTRKPDEIIVIDSESEDAKALADKVMACATEAEVQAVLAQQ